MSYCPALREKSFETLILDLVNNTLYYIENNVLNWQLDQSSAKPAAETNWSFVSPKDIQFCMMHKDYPDGYTFSLMKV